VLAVAAVRRKWCGGVGGTNSGNGNDEGC
jgi:hypothetical protein